jgi:alkaline phosphatase
MAAHKNDGPTHYREIVAYQRAVQVAKRYAKSHEKTLVISVSDHETGGLALGRQPDLKAYPDYVWYPGPIINATRSVEFLSNATYYASGDEGSSLETFVREDVLGKGLAIWEPVDEMVKELLASSRNRTIFEKVLSTAVSEAAQIGWSTWSHTGVDVNLYAYGHESAKLMGNHDNTFIASFIEDLLGLDLDAVTEKVRQDPVTDMPWTNVYAEQRPPFRVRHYHVQDSVFD